MAVRFDPLRHRLRVQGLAGRPFTDPSETLSWLGAVQSQEYALAKWSVGQRTQEVDERRVDQAIADGAILRTHILRPTWHFVSPADLRWMQALTSPRVRAVLAPYDRTLGLDGKLLARSASAITGALEGGRHLTRTQLAAVLLDAGIEARGQRLARIVMHAELDALICSGVPSGRQQTYALVDERAPATAPLDREEALRELALRYFRSHGPATLRDFRWWSSLTAADASRAVEAAGSRIERREVAGRAFMWVEAAAIPRPRQAPSAHLVQIYDEVVIAYTESRDLLSSDPRSRLVMPKGSNVMHAVLLNGSHVGGWRRLVKGRSIELDLRLAPKLDRAERAAIDDAARRYREFSAAEVAVRVSSIRS